MNKIVILLIIGTCCGCISYQRCADKYGNTSHTDTTIVVRERVVPVEIAMPTDTIETIINCGDALPKYAAYKSRNGILHTEVDAQNVIVRVKTTIVPKYIHDTIRMTDTTTFVREQVVLAKNNSAWKIAALILAGIMALFIALVVWLYIKINKH